MNRGDISERVWRRLLGLPKPLSKEHLDRLAREKRWADLAEEADKRSARARSGEVIITEASYGKTIVGGSGGMDGLT